MFAAAILLSALGFAAVILFLRGGLYKLDGGDPPLPSVDKGGCPLVNKFSVVIAARNERRNIRECLRSVCCQDIPGDQYEVIVIDDRSEDETPEILRELAGKYKNLRVITIAETPPGVSPKKHAVMTGINSASNEIIVFTDADCRVPPRWLSTIGTFFTDGADLVQGVTAYKYVDGMNKTFFGLQSVDFLSHGIIAAAAIGANLPINSNANNMAFRRDMFDEIGGYGNDSGVTLGDDDHLLQRAWRHGRKIRYMTSPHAAVDTAPTETVRALLEQRRRWGSVTVHYGKRQIALLSTVFIFYLSIALTAVMSIFDLSYLPVFAALMFVKISGELVLMIPGSRIFNKKKLRKYIVPASIIQLPIVLMSVISGVFWKFDWKGQKLSRKTGITGQRP